MTTHTTRTITLGSNTLPVVALPLGRLRQLVPAFNRAGRAFVLGQVDDDAFDDVFAVLAAGTGLSAETLEAMPGDFRQLVAAVEVIADVCGLMPKAEGPPLGEPVPGASPASTPGTPSTPA